MSSMNARIRTCVYICICVSCIYCAVLSLSLSLHTCIGFPPIGTRVEKATRWRLLGQSEQQCLANTPQKGFPKARGDISSLDLLENRWHFELQKIRPFARGGKQPKTGYSAKHVHCFFFCRRAFAMFRGSPELGLLLDWVSYKTQRQTLRYFRPQGGASF